MKLPEIDKQYAYIHRRQVKPQHLELLRFIYGWILSDNPPMSKTIGQRKYYLINYGYLSHYFKTSYKNIQNRINRLCSDDLNPISYISKYVDANIPHRTLSWISMDESIARQCVAKNEENHPFLLKLGKEKKMNEPLFEIEECKINYAQEAIAIVNMCINKYHEYFPHKIPSPNEKPSKTYLDSLRKVTDIYNGLFTKSRFYSLGGTFVENNSINVEGWQDKVKEVKGNWGKVRALILQALKNFDTMHLPTKMPFSKEHLQKNLSLWFYDGYMGDGQSQFVQCLFEPESVSDHLSEKKADKIFESLPKEARKAGNMFFDMNPQMGSVTLWSNVEKILKWSEVVFHNDRSAKYWADNARQIPLKFAQYCLDNKIKVNTVTLDIERAVMSNGPWCWFVQEAITKHGLPENLVMCGTYDDVDELYNHNSDIPF